jgi:large subunit ribosomal protein L35
MPKQKTHSGAKKRFKVTGRKKIMRQGTNMRHNLEHKSSKDRRRLSTDSPLKKADMKQARKLLGM